MVMVGLPLGHWEARKLYTIMNFKINLSGDFVFSAQKKFAESLISKDSFEADFAAYLRNLAVQDKIFESNETVSHIDVCKK